ncbi:MAG: hypothetical protein VW378_00650 [bacterium]
MKKKYALTLLLVLGLEKPSLPASLNPFNIPKYLIDTRTVIINTHTQSHTAYDQKKLTQKLNKKLTLYNYQTKTVSQNITKPFQKKLNTLQAINTPNIQTLIQTHYQNSFQQLITNKENLQKNKDILTKNTSKTNFAETKGKSKALTKEDLVLLQNSSFMYLPFITKITQIPIKNNIKPLKTSLSGGVLWFQILTQPDNSITLHFLKKIPINVHDASRWIHLDIYEEFAAAAQNKSKTIPELKQRQTITYALNDYYELAPSPLQTIRIGDEFLLKGYEQNNTGIKIQKQGLIQITKVKSTPTAPNQAKQLWGDWQTVGSWAESYPRLGLDFLASYGQILNIEGKNISSFSSSITFPLAKILNKPNWFLSIHADLSLSNINIAQTPHYTIHLKRLTHWTLMLEKRYWFKRHSIGLLGGLGIQERAYGQQLRTQNWQFGWLEKNSAFLLTFGLNYRKAINENWYIYSQFSKQLTSKALFELLETKEKSSINFNNYHISIGLYYAIPSQSILSSGSAARTVSNILDIWRITYKVIDVFMQLNNSKIKPIEHEEDNKDKDKKKKKKKRKRYSKIKKGKYREFKFRF